MVICDHVIMWRMLNLSHPMHTLPVEMEQGKALHFTSAPIQKTSVLLEVYLVALFLLNGSNFAV